MHNYSILPKGKNKILLNIGILSVAISSLLNGLISKLFGIGAFYIRSGVVAFGIYFIINQYLWKFKIFNLILKVPNLNGIYEVEGYNVEKNIPWQGTITIEQTLDDISIHLDGPTSQSDSKSAQTTYLNNRGYELKYSYKNERPGQDCCELRPHEGGCTLVFDKKIQSAEGEYYTNIKDRKSFGTMKLMKIINVQEESECTQ